MKCGLLGRKLAHSYSPQIHSFLGTYSYELFEREPEDLCLFFQEKAFDAINVTIPYKKDVMQYCDELSPVAKKIGSVNTIVRRGNRLIGHNSDYFGFSSMLTESGLQLNGKKVLVLGSGGASVTAQAVLKEIGAKVVIISREGQNNYSNLHLHADAACIVNCTPVGMFPNNGISPVDITYFPELTGVLDMIYNPAKTKLLQIDITMFNNQYGLLSVLDTKNVHDRYIIIDQKDLYHIGGSIKDLGKKITSIIESDPLLINNLLSNI